MSKKGKNSNMRIAGLFILLVVCLILFSIVIKFAVLFENSKFDPAHRYIVSFISNSKTQIVSFSPQNNSISILNIDKKLDENKIRRTLEIPVNSSITVNNTINNKNLAVTLLNSSISLGSLRDLNSIDSIRLFLFARSVALTSIYQRDFSEDLSSEEKSTVLSLSFTDPSIYQESQSIQIVNASEVPGLGSRLAGLINNIGGNVILVSSPQTSQDKSIIMYSQKNYTVNFLSSYLNFPIRKSDKQGVADVIIILGKDKVNSLKF